MAQVGEILPCGMQGLLHPWSVMTKGHHKTMYVMFGHRSSHNSHIFYSSRHILDAWTTLQPFFSMFHVLIKNAVYGTFRDVHHHFSFLTSCVLVAPYVDTNLCQHWIKEWLDVWQLQAINRTNMNISLVSFCSIHLRAISQKKYPIYYSLYWVCKLYS